MINRDLPKTQMVTVMLRERPRTKERWLLVGADVVQRLVEEQA